MTNHVAWHEVRASLLNMRLDHKVDNTASLEVFVSSLDQN